MQEIYQKVANCFKKRILEVWKSEETMRAEWEKRLSHVPFSRTDHWQAILYHMFRDCWMEAGPAVKVEPTGYDRHCVLKLLHPLLDYNIFSQILLNLQHYNGMAYQTADAQKEIQRIEKEWKKKQSTLLRPGERPLGAADTMVKIPLTQQENAFNLYLSTIRSLKIITNFTPAISFRVSPMGKTPAFADSNNVSMLGMGADKYLRVLSQLEVYYLIWSPGTSPLMARRDTGPGFPNVAAETQKSGTWFWADGIEYPFVSKSGGEILHDVLFARKLVYEIFGAIDVTKSILTILPRMNSLMVVMDKDNQVVVNILRKLQAQYGCLQIQLGSRVRAEDEAVNPTVTELESADELIEICAKLANPIEAARIRSLKGKFSIKQHESDLRAGSSPSSESPSSSLERSVGTDGVSAKRLHLDIAKRLQEDGLIP
jgi:hypothetical protein